MVIGDESAELHEPEVLGHWDIPGLAADAPVRITAKSGQSTTVVGANGSGKSALGLWMEQNNGGPAGIRRLIAHRRLWFEYAGPAITSAERQSTGRNVSTWSRQDDSRYLDHANAKRASIVLFDVLARVNHENALLVDMYHEGASRQEVETQHGPRFLDRLNAIFRAAGLAIELKLTDEQTLDAVNRVSGAEYPIFKMSDGEKSALLLAGEVLTTDEGSIYVIDEPERHLHRSISAGLVEAIIADRPDSHFVVLTHDLELAAALGKGSGQMFSLTGCTWAGESPGSWQLFPIDASDELPESARLAILGGRRELLFIEGETHSLDMKLYTLLFPEWTLFPTGGCDQVIRAVTGLRTSQPHHWLSARGVVDGDWRDEDEKLSLRARGILPLPVSEVENLYYSADVIRAVAARQAESVDESVDALVDLATTRALSALGADGTPERLAASLALTAARRHLLAELPTTIDASSTSISVTVASPYAQLLTTIADLLRASDLDGLIRLLPVRDTALRAQVARSLRFQNIADYEAAARVQIRNDSTLAAAVRTFIGPMPS